MVTEGGRVDSDNILHGEGGCMTRMILLGGGGEGGCMTSYWGVLHGKGDCMTTMI